MNLLQYWQSSPFQLQSCKEELLGRITLRFTLYIYSCRNVCLSPGTETRGNLLELEATKYLVNHMVDALDLAERKPGDQVGVGADALHKFP